MDMLRSLLICHSRAGGKSGLVLRQTRKMNPGFTESVGYGACGA
jgi:hypothetical protein